MSLALSGKVRGSMLRAAEDLFSDAFLAHDRTMRQLLHDDICGFVPLRRLALFPPMRLILDDARIMEDRWEAAMADVLSGSPKLVLSRNGEAVARKEPLADQTERDRRTLVLQNIPAEATLADIQKFLEPYGRAVSLTRKWSSVRDGDAAPKVRELTTVEFERAESVAKLREAAPKFTGCSSPLKIMDRQAYLLAKEAERAAPAVEAAPAAMKAAQPAPAVEAARDAARK
jgi:hypothetical protein